MARNFDLSLTRTNTAISGVTGEYSNTNRTEPICLCFGPKSLDSSLMVVQINSSPILGIDVISQLHLQLDFVKPKHCSCSSGARAIDIAHTYMTLKSNIAKAQLAVASVQFLGQSVTAGQRSILPDRTVAVCTHRTVNKKRALLVLSMCNYSHP